MFKFKVNQIHIVGATGNTDIPEQEFEAFSAATVRWTKRALRYAFPVLFLGGTGGTAAWYMSPGETQPPVAVHEPASKAAPDKAVMPDQGGLPTQIQQKMAEDLQRLEALIEERARHRTVEVPPPPAMTVQPIRVQLELPEHLMIGVEGPKAPEPQGVRPPDPPNNPKTDMTPAQRRQYEVWVERR